MKPATFRWFLVGGAAMCVAAGIAGAAMTCRSDVAPAGAASNDARTGAETSAARRLSTKTSASAQARTGTSAVAASMGVRAPTEPPASASAANLATSAPAPSATASIDAPPASSSMASSAPSAAPRGSSAPTGDALRDLDKKIIPLLQESLGKAELKDAFPGEKYEVDLFQDQGHPKPNRVRIDLNRNKKWDERWTSDDDEELAITREVSPKDNELYTRTYSLKGETWVLKRDASR